MSKYTGIIIEESLENKDVLKGLKIVKTEVEKVTESHKTPHIKQWTMQTVEIPESDVERITEEISQSLDKDHVWYADFRNDEFHFVIFRDKVFKLNRDKKSDYDEMVKYGLSVGVPDYQLPNFADLPVDVLDSFLREANQNTYANENVKKASPRRPGSTDYHFEKGDLIFHDTYFGSTKFIGEEIVYKSGKPVWGMNYHGFTLDNSMSEGLFDAILRPALMSDPGDNIPVRGPKELINGWWKYTFSYEGDLANFTGVEEISKKGKVVTRLYCHGGFIE